MNLTLLRTLFKRSPYFTEHKEEGTHAVLVLLPLHYASSQLWQVLKSSCGGGKVGILFLNHSYSVCAQSWRFQAPPDSCTFRGGKPEFPWQASSAESSLQDQPRSCSSVPGGGKLHPLGHCGPLFVFINRALLAHNHAHSFIQLSLWLLSCYNGRAESLWISCINPFPVKRPQLVSLSHFKLDWYIMLWYIINYTSMEWDTTVAMLKDEHGRPNNVPCLKDIHFLSSRTCRCYFKWQKELCRWDFIKDLRWWGDYSGLYEGSYKRDERRSDEEVDVMTEARGLRDTGRGREQRNASALRSWKRQERGRSPISSQSEQPCRRLDCSTVKPLSDSASGTAWE